MHQRVVEVEAQRMGGGGGVAPQQRVNHWLLRQGWMVQWLDELFHELHPRATAEEIDNDIKQKPQEATARYLAFLGRISPERIALRKVS